MLDVDDVRVTVLMRRTRGAGGARIVSVCLRH